MEKADYIKNICRPGKGVNSCKFLIVGEKGYFCGKTDPKTRNKINKTNARGADNCEGQPDLNNPDISKIYTNAKAS